LNFRVMIGRFPRTADWGRPLRPHILTALDDPAPKERPRLGLA
jgi:hypothetical protein